MRLEEYYIKERRILHQRKEDSTIFTRDKYRDSIRKDSISSLKIIFKDTTEKISATRGILHARILQF